jgi:hypothetical protein
MLGTAASTLAEHAQLLPRLATTEAVERTHRTFVAELAAIGASAGGQLGEARQALLSADRRAEQRADDGKADAHAAWAAVRRLEAELQHKLSRDEAMALLGALRRDVAAERAAAEQTARLARDEGALRLVELSELAHAAAAIADEAHATAAKAVPRADVHSLEQRLSSTSLRTAFDMLDARADEGVPPRARLAAQPYHSPPHSAPGASARGGRSPPPTSRLEAAGPGPSGGTAQALLADGIRSDLELRRRQLEERRQSIAASRVSLRATGTHGGGGAVVPEGHRAVVIIELE